MGGWVTAARADVCADYSVYYDENGDHRFYRMDSSDWPKILTGQLPTEGEPPSERQIEVRDDETGEIVLVLVEAP